MSRADEPDNRKGNRTMPKYVKDNSTHATRALQIYLVLIGLAANRQTIQYRELSAIMNYGVGPILAHPLGLLMAWCAHNKQPALTWIVVEKETGLPSTGLSTVANSKVPAEQQRVFSYPWYTIFPPNIDELDGFASRNAA